ncbi:hypothetical protein [Winogradskyella costae]|uniref:hypothetical protein n=1 Tax=Winogradskyella costae TaxID=2697008 RepID=UPI0015CE3B5B|nr:hypothetical protein [Winogradskyella costae]
MKKLQFIFMLMLMPLCMFSQQSIQKKPLPLVKYNANVNMPLTAVERAQIIEAYGESSEKLVFSIPNRLKSIKNILRNRVEVKLIVNKNGKKAWPKLSEVSGLEKSKSFDRNKFNPLIYGFNFNTRFGATYQIDNTNYYIIIKSQFQ